MEFLDDGYIIPRFSPEDPLPAVLPDELLLLLKTLALSPEQLEQQRSKNKPPKLAVGRPEMGILQKAVQLKCSQYATNIELDQALLAELNTIDATSPLEGSQRRLKMAVLVRIGEKEILQELSTQLDRLLSTKRGAEDEEDSRESKAQRT